MASMEAESGAKPRTTRRVCALVVPGLLTIAAAFTCPAWIPEIVQLPAWGVLLVLLALPAGAVAAGIAAHRIGQPEGFADLVVAFNLSGAVLFLLPALFLLFASPS